MILKTVYGPPPADTERIGAVETEEECCIRETEQSLHLNKKQLKQQENGSGRLMTMRSLED